MGDVTKMGWETRGSATKYFVRTIRVPGGFERQYFGRGPLAEIAVHTLEVERDRCGRSPRWIKIRRTLESADKMVIKFGNRADYLLRATLFSAGLHSIRGTWKRRQKPVTPPNGIVPATDLDSLFRQAQTGYSFAVEALKAFLAADTATWGSAVQLARDAKAAWLGILAKKDPTAMIQLQKEITQLHTEVAMPASSPIDMVLVDRVILTMVEARACELLLAPMEGIALPPTIQAFLQSCREKANKRHKRARVRLALLRNKLRHGQPSPLQVIHRANQ